MQHHLDVGVGAQLVQLARRLHGVPDLGRLHGRADARRQRVHRGAELDQLGFADRAGAARQLQRRAHRRATAGGGERPPGVAVGARRQQGAAGEAVLEGRPMARHFLRRHQMPQAQFDDVVEPGVGQRRSLRRKLAARRRLEGRFPARGALSHQHIGVARAECLFGGAPRAPLLERVVGEDADHHQHPDRQQPDLQIAHGRGTGAVCAALRRRAPRGCAAPPRCPPRPRATRRTRAWSRRSAARPSPW